MGIRSSRLAKRDPRYADGAFRNRSPQSRSLAFFTSVFGKSRRGINGGVTPGADIGGIIL